MLQKLRASDSAQNVLQCLETIWRLPSGSIARPATELALGDLVSGEERYVVLMLEVLPLPLLPDGSLPDSLRRLRLAHPEL